MTVPFRTFALFGFALAMIGVGYLFGPQPGAATQPSPPAQRVAEATFAPPVPSAKPDTTLATSRPPVPLVTAPRTPSYTPVEQAAASAAPTVGSQKPSVDMGTFKTNPPDPDDKSQALAAPGPSSGDKSADNSQAKRAIEFDGYRNVRGLEKGPDGMWHGRAMRGRNEISVRVDASGNVSAE
jgi:hypothetical protein